MAKYMSIWKGGEPAPYKCSVCGGTFTGPHYCTGKPTETGEREGP